MLNIGSVYDKQPKRDSFRILVERKWPRGVSISRARINLWLKEVAASESGSKLLSGDFEAFREGYKKELSAKLSILMRIKAMEARIGIITLVHSTKDAERNSAAVLKEELEKISLPRQL